MRAVAPSSAPFALRASACFFTKFNSGGSSACAARRNRSSRRSTTLAKVSRNMPDIMHNTSRRGRPPNVSNGRSSKRTIRPVPSLTSAAPTNARTIATLSPFVLMASSPHKFTLTVSGYIPSCSARCWAMIASAASVPRSTAAGLGMRYGSNAWMLRPVGRTPGPSRSKSPPAAGRTYSPFMARTTPVSSFVVWLRRSRISNA
mmetsp:Transcript_153853/g.279456  ORF Transcript_153853/g.279456 Transcript_153853/m.279456 type:complete len:203 (+) Transcript_153853:742-1350(+)